MKWHRAGDGVRLGSPMPTYIYQVVTEDGSEGEIFEFFQSIKDDALTHHPHTRQPVRRLPTAPNLPRTWTDAATKSSLSDKNLDSLGFTKYQKAGDGVYEKKAGPGPDTFKRTK